MAWKKLGKLLHWPPMDDMPWYVLFMQFQLPRVLFCSPQYEKSMEILIPYPHMRKDRSIMYIPASDIAISYRYYRIHLVGHTLELKIGCVWARVKSLKSSWNWQNVIRSLFNEGSYICMPIGQPKGILATPTVQISINCCIKFHCSAATERLCSNLQKIDK